MAAPTSRNGSTIACRPTTAPTTRRRPRRSPCWRSASRSPTCGRTSTPSRRTSSSRRARSGSSPTWRRWSERTSLPIRRAEQPSRRAQHRRLASQQGRQRCRALARAISGWPADPLAEFFASLGWSQNLNHLRLAHPLTPDLRDPYALSLLGHAVDPHAHAAEFRPATPLAGARVNPRTLGIGVAAWGTPGRYEIKNVSLFLHRLQTFALSGVTPAAAVPGLPCPPPPPASPSTRCSTTLPGERRRADAGRIRAGARDLLGRGRGGAPVRRAPGQRRRCCSRIPARRQRVQVVHLRRHVAGGGASAAGPALRLRRRRCWADLARHRRHAPPRAWTPSREPALRRHGRLAGRRRHHHPGIAQHPARQDRRSDAFRIGSATPSAGRLTLTVQTGRDGLGWAGRPPPRRPLPRRRHRRPRRRPRPARRGGWRLRRPAAPLPRPGRRRHSFVADDGASYTSAGLEPASLARAAPGSVAPPRPLTARTALPVGFIRLDRGAGGMRVVDRGRFAAAGVLFTAELFSGALEPLGAIATINRAAASHPDYVVPDPWPASPTGRARWRSATPTTPGKARHPSHAAGRRDPHPWVVVNRPGAASWSTCRSWPARQPKGWSSWSPTTAAPGSSPPRPTRSPSSTMPPRWRG